MARAAGAKGGFYISHIRDEADLAWTPSAKPSPSASGPSCRCRSPTSSSARWACGARPTRSWRWSRRRETGRGRHRRRYPYLAWQSTPRVLIPNKQDDDPASVARASTTSAARKNVQITRLEGPRAFMGKRLDEIARAVGVSDIEAYIQIVKDDDAA